MITSAIAKHIKDKGISVKRISEKTGISYQVLCNSFDENKTRELRADELLKVCKFLELNLEELTAKVS